MGIQAGRGEARKELGRSGLGNLSKNGCQESHWAEPKVRWGGIEEGR